MTGFRLIDRSDQVLKAFSEQIERGLESIGETAEGYAKDNAPVDTGRLRNSITYATKDYSGKGTYTDNNKKAYSDATAKSTPDERTVAIGTNVEYAVYVEFGDKAKHTSGAAHFLKSAATGHSQEYKNLIETSLRA